jgi:thiamine-phosphate pyrophosphorylase
LPEVDFDLYLITDLGVCGTEAALLAAVAAALRAGGPRVAVQLRDKNLQPERRERIGVALRDLTRAQGSSLWVHAGADPDLPRRLGADGVHLPGRAPVLPGLPFARSCHGEADLRAAAVEGASFAGKGAPIGWRKFEQWVERSPLPVVALGGMLGEHAPEARKHGAAAVAAIRGVLGQDDPGAAVRRFLRGPDS